METELFIHFAEIAGVFVGFGALISLRSTALTDPHDVMYLRAVLGLGIWVVVAALLPITVSRFGVDDHGLWLPCALVGLALWAALVLALSRTGESRAISRSPEKLDRFFPVVGLPLHIALAGSLLLVVLGRWPDHEAAFYVTSLTTGVVFAAYTLLAFVMSQNPHTSAHG